MWIICRSCLLQLSTSLSKKWPLRLSKIYCTVSVYMHAVGYSHFILCIFTMSFMLFKYDIFIRGVILPSTCQTRDLSDVLWNLFHPYVLIFCEIQFCFLKVVSFTVSGNALYIDCIWDLHETLKMGLYAYINFNTRKINVCQVIWGLPINYVWTTIKHLSIWNYKALFQFLFYVTDIDVKI